MNGENLLDVAERKGLLDAKTLRKLRAQIAAADRPVSAQRVVKLLVNRNLVTKPQAKMLLDSIAAATATEDQPAGGERPGAPRKAERKSRGTSSPKTSTSKSKSAHSKSAKPREDAPELAPIDSSPELMPLDSSPDLVPVDSSPELVPIDSSPELAPIDSSPELTPIDSSPDLRPIDSAPRKPATGGGSRRREARAPDDGLTPDDASELTSELAHDEDLGAWGNENTLDASLDASHDYPMSPPDKLAAKPSRKKGLFGRLGRGGKGKNVERLGKKTAKGWDSPLMLIGSGVLILLVALGLFLFFFLNRGSGDDMFNLAEEEYRTQSYTQAMSSYQKFLKLYPKHPKASLARVRHGMAQLRHAVDSNKDWERALELANSQLPVIKSEEAFPDARPELGSLLTSIYGGFVERAEQAEDTATKAEMLAKAEQAMKLVENPEYLPSSVRTGQQPKIEEIGDRIVLIERDINRDKELASAIAKIQQATERREIAEAYAVRRDLLGKYPALQNNAQLREVVQAITLAEKAKVTVSGEPHPAETGDRPQPVARRVVLVDRRSNQAPEAAEPAVVTMVVDGAAYGIQVGNGRVLWRHWLGYTSRIAPVPVSNEVGADVLLVDLRNHELTRVRAQTGEVVWRLGIGAPMTAPVVLGAGAYVSTESGQLWSVDLETGQSAQQAQMPQTHLAPSAVDADHGFVYAVGQHSSLYVLNADTLECVEVAYTGHKPNSIEVAPVRAGGYLFIVENEGAGAAAMHVLQSDANGMSLQAAIEPQRLDGRVVVPMVVFGRRVLVCTDRGGMYVYDVDPANATEPVRVMAKTLPSAGDRFAQYVAVENGQVFVAGRQLARFELQASRGELIRKWAGLDGASFTGPIHLYRDLLIHARRRKGNSVTTVEATRISLGRQIADEGQTVWSTELAAAPAMEVQFDKERKSLVALSSAGVVWDVNSQAMSSGYLDQVADRANPAALPGPMKHAVSLSNDRVVLVAESLSTRVLVYDPRASKRLQELTLPIPHQQLSCVPVAMGDALVACSSDGPIYLTQPAASDSPEVLPFQPKLSADMRVQWLRPAVVDGDRPKIVAGERGGVLYLLGVETSPSPHLASLATRQLSGQLTAELATIGDRVIVVYRDGMRDVVMSLMLPDMQQEQRVEVTGQVVAGPMRVGDFVLLATGDNVLHAIDASGNVSWTTPLPHGPLAGVPLEDGGRMILVASSGYVWQVASHSGAVLPWSGGGAAGSGSTDSASTQEATGEAINVGEPLSGKAVVMGSRLFLLGRDCTLYITDVPPPPNSQTGRLP